LVDPGCQCDSSQYFLVLWLLRLQDACIRMLIRNWIQCCYRMSLDTSFD
jgi:hypothetical protein